MINANVNRTELIALLPKGICAEIGVARGKFSKKILKRNQPTKLYLIDSWECFDLGYLDGNMVDQKDHNDRYTKVYNMFSHYDNVEIIRKRSTEALETFDNNYFDWVYIDADHSYEGCLLDLNLADKKVKPTGIICGHDYLAEGYSREGFGVNDAVDEFVKKNNYYFICLTNELDYKSYAITKSKDTYENIVKKINE